jgi:peptide deformylase
MKRLTILEYPDPRLRTKAAPVAQVDDALRRFIDDLLETMYASAGIGLAATQVDVHQRVIVVDVSDEKNTPLVMVNPEILTRGQSGMAEEKCLSVPGVVDVVSRDLFVRVRALGRDGAPFELDAEGLLAVCIQHEMDHLEGTLFVDYLSLLKRARLRYTLGRAKRQKAAAGARSQPPAP